MPPSTASTFSFSGSGTRSTTELAELYRQGKPTPFTSGIAIMDEKTGTDPSLDETAQRCNEMIQEAHRLQEVMARMQHAKQHEQAQAQAQAGVHHQAIIEQLVHENNQLKQFCERLQAEKRVLQHQLAQAAAQVSTHAQGYHGQPHRGQPQAHPGYLRRDSTADEQLARLMQARAAQQQQQAHRRSLSNPSIHFNQGLHHPFQVPHAHTPRHNMYGKSPASTPALSSGSSDWDDDDEHPFMVGSLPAHLHR